MSCWCCCLHPFRVVPLLCTPGTHTPCSLSRAWGEEESTHTPPARPPPRAGKGGERRRHNVPAHLHTRTHTPRFVRLRGARDGIVERGTVDLSTSHTPVTTRAQTVSPREPSCSDEPPRPLRKEGAAASHRHISCRTRCGKAFFWSGMSRM